MTAANPIQIAIVGAGASGLLTAVKLRQAGFNDILILERGASVGGTWRDNVYPGAACDMPSHLYSFSFELNPDWSRVYSPQPEIFAYLESVARKYGLLPFIRFGVDVQSATYEENQRLWNIQLSGGDAVWARFLFLGAGGLVRPACPTIPDLENFGGQTFHSARWPQGYDFRGRRVAVIGSAASAIQLVPHVAREADRLFLFQRTANWILPKGDRLFPPWIKALWRRFPRLLKLYRRYLFSRLELAFKLFHKDSRAARWIERWALRAMRGAVNDPALHAKLTPDYPIGCKRILISDEFYPALNRPNVEVITSPIISASTQGLRTENLQTCEVDTIIFATGFKVGEIGLKVYGRGGQPMSEGGQGEAYKGVCVAGFPNLFLLLGPNSALGHNSVWLMIEAQAEYAVRAISEVLARKAHGLEVTAPAMAAYNSDLHKRFGDLVWSAGCLSWYKTAAGKNFTIYPGDVRSFQRRLTESDWDAYQFG